MGAAPKSINADLMSDEEFEEAIVAGYRQAEAGQVIDIETVMEYFKNKK